jgi:type 1 fimbriae regulatory protein FimB/type 1 fimbriae regulatory protein FimE
LTESEVEPLIEAARKRGRNGSRGGAAILLAYRDALRAAELRSLRWAQIDLNSSSVACVGLRACIHCMDQSFRRYDHCRQERVRVVDRGRITSNNGLVLANGSAHRPNPHMLCHSTEYKLANEGHDTRSLAHYLQSTARYSFAGLWQDCFWQD